MVRSIRAAGIASFLACLVICGCPGDPGYGYDPTNTKGQIVDRWSETIDGVSFSAGHEEVLAGNSYAGYGFDVVNHSEKTVVVLSGELVTNGRTMKAEAESEPPRSIPPRTLGTAFLLCRFVDPLDASQILGDTMTWTMRVRIGDDERSVSVTLKRK